MYSVVVIDDEYFLRQSLIKCVDWKKYGFVIVGDAEDGEEGYTIIQKEQPHIALIDITMPIMNGLELVQRLRNENNDIEIIIISGYSEFEYAKKCVTLNVNNYLVKPINDTQIIDELLKIKAKLDKKFESIDFSSTNHKIVKEVKSYIVKNLQNNTLKIDDISKKLGYNYHYVCKLFLEQTHMNIGKYIVKKRMEKAKEVIESGESDFYVVATKTGYADPIYFAKSFKKFYGITPVQYVKKLQNIADIENEE